MSADRGLMKRAIVGLLDVVANEHPLKHQDSKTARYVLTARGGATVEIMFEKNEESPPNLWCLEAAADLPMISELKPKHSFRADLKTKRGKDGNLLYGRHSALQHMPQLGGADLVCFAPKTFQEVKKIVDRLLDVTASDLLWEQ